MKRSKSKADSKKVRSAKSKLKKLRASKKKKVSKKKISGGFNLSFPKRSGRAKLTDRQIDLIYFMTTVISLLGIIFGKEVVLRLLELVISKAF